VLRLFLHRPGLGVEKLSTIAEAKAGLAAPENVLWVDFDARTAESDEVLSTLFGFHPLAIEDVYKDGHAPKLEDYDRYVYLIIQALALESGWDLTDVQLIELDLFIGKNFVVTHHAGPLPAVEAVVGPTCFAGKNHMEKGAAFLAHALIDAVVDRFEPLTVAMDHEIDALELRVLRGTDEQALARITELQRSLHHLRRVAIRQRDLLQKLSRGEFGEELPEEVRPFFRDVLDHFTEFTESLDVERDDLQSLFNAFHSLAAQRMNEIMKMLTLISTIMLPLSFIAGVYGMNFEHMPELKWKYGYFEVLGLMAIVAFGMVLYFRHRRWL
jgi:magnesium transporter